MCGIAGLCAPAIGAAALTQDVTRMLAQIGHRGPDGAGYVADNGFAMGAVRLAIIDPTAGAQPISDETGRYWICYNGEIYNYRELRTELVAQGRRFRTHCDTEVVLQAWLAWGPACLARFNGGFAFAIYDSESGAVFLARDRFGKRPLFIARQNGALYFASEMKAFLAIDGFTFEQDPAQVASILAQWTPLPHQSGFRDIDALPMGCWMKWQAGIATVHTYDTLRFDHGSAAKTETEALEQIRDTLTDSVRLRLRSDVEVGVYLSGGVDSAIIAALVRDITDKRLATFSVEFEDAEFDESADQRSVAAHLGTDHHALRISHADIADATPDAVFHAEMPAFRSAFVPMYLLSRRTRDEGIKVILSGEGADEAFLGYDLFKETMLREHWHSLSDAMRRDRLARLYPHLSHYGAEDIAAVAGLYSQFSTERMPGLFSHEMRFQNGRFSARLMTGKDDPFASIAALVATEDGFSGLSAVQKAQWLEYKTLLPGYLLSTQGDRMSLAHGVENRCPFLDPAVFALANATNLKFDDGYTEKRLLREAFRGKVPDPIIDKRKFPYRAPDAAAFAARKPDYLDLILSDDELAKIPFLDARFARRLANKVLSRPAGEVSTKENQTFMYLLSITLLHRSFVRREGLPTPCLPPLERAIDLTRGRVTSPMGV